MRSQRLYGAISASLAVSLGLGLIYLYAVGRIEAFTAIGAVLAMALVMILIAALADMARQDRPRDRARLPAHRW